MQDPARRTPLKGVRLRQPGQSIREEIEREREDVLFDHILPFAIVVTLWVMTGVAWLFRTPPVVPFVLSSIALVVIAVRSVLGRLPPTTRSTVCASASTASEPLPSTSSCCS